MDERRSRVRCRRPSRWRVLMTCVLSGAASAGVLDRISQDKTIRIAYREDAPPFSSKDKIGEPVGFMVDLVPGGRQEARRAAAIWARST